MAINKDFDPNFPLKIDLMLIIFSLQVTLFEGPFLFDDSASLVHDERCEGNLKDKDVLKRCASFLTENISLLEGCSWRRSKDEVDKVAMFLIGGKIFSTEGALWNLLLGLKDEWECALDARTDVTKTDRTNETLVLFSFCLDLLVLPDMVSSWAACFLTATSLFFPGVDMILLMSPGLMAFADVEFTSNVDSESWLGTGASGSFSSDGEVSEINSLRSSCKWALVNFLRRCDGGFTDLQPSLLRLIVSSLRLPVLLRKIIAFMSGGILPQICFTSGVRKLKSSLDM